MDPILLTPTDFVALVNQTLEFAYPSITVEGELSNFRVSKNRWVYFDIKDDYSSVKFFGTVYSLPGPLEDGMVLRVGGAPKLHPLYGFSVNVQSISLSGEGTIKKAFDLLFKKLTHEGLFDQERKRVIAYPPSSIGLVTSSESAAYADFIKIINARWGGISIELADVQVQGDPAAMQIVRAIEHFNSLGTPPELIVLIRGGGSSDDLQVFNTELVTRAVAASRIPTVVAIGHEVDTSLAELAADLRASTPSNAAELIVPDKNALKRDLVLLNYELGRLLSLSISEGKKDLVRNIDQLSELINTKINRDRTELNTARQIIELLNPKNILKRGYSIIRDGKKVIHSSDQTTKGQVLSALLYDGNINIEVK